MIELVPLQMEQAIVDMFESFHIFVGANILVFVAVGLGYGRSMAMAAYGGFLAFAWIAVSVDIPLYTNLMYVVLTLVFVGFAAKLMRLEMWGDG